jgi:hypothetical protein
MKINIDISCSELNSSMIEYMHLIADNKQGKLGVTFKNGTSYIYDGINLATFLAVIKADSVGESFSKYIKDQYPFKNVGDCNGESPLTKVY